MKIATSIKELENKQNTKIKRNLRLRAFNSDSKYLDDNGRITLQPVFSECVTYTIDYTINGETKSVTLSSIVPGTEK